MIEQITKRDGSRQPYDPNKLNKWAIWAGEDVRNRIDWSSVVMETVKSMDKVVYSQDLQRELIKNFVRKKRWPEALIAGRLYAALTRKELFDDKLPTVRKLHSKLAEIGLMVKLNYTDEDYMHVEKIIDHDRDMHMAEFQAKQLRRKYSIRNELTGQEYETPQFIFMRMAMDLAENQPREIRLERVKSFYDSFSLTRVNAPTPNYINLGTKLKGFVSCCLYRVNDNIPSLAAGDYIAYRMTAIAAGMGGILTTRSIGDPVRGGKITHQGKFPYFKAQAGAVGANKQAGRAGACTTYFSLYDPEAEMILMLQNPRTPADKRNRDMHFAYIRNNFFTKKAALNEDIFTFNVYTAPDLYEAQFSGDRALFEELYRKYENDPKFKKNYVSARQLLLKAREQRNEVSTLYSFRIDEANYHTPHKDPIHSSNLCLEITQPTWAYDNIEQLSSPGDLSYIEFEDENKIIIRIPGELLIDTKRGKIPACRLTEEDEILHYDRTQVRTYVKGTEE